MAESTLRLADFARAAAPLPQGSKPSDVLKVIYAARPELRGQPTYFPSQGACAYTVIIGDEVFKGPKQEEIFLRDFDKEPVLLKSLAGKGLPVPDVTCEGQDPSFYGMTRMPGVCVEDELERMTDGERQQIARDVVGFVIDLAKAAPAEDGMVLTHGDLHGKNILIDPETKRLTGIIDFGQMARMTRDAWRPSSTFSPDFQQMLSDAYAERKMELPAPKPAAPDLTRRRTGNGLPPIDPGYVPC